MDDDAYFNRGFAKNELGDYQGAIDDYTKAIGIDPSNGDAFINRGATKFELEVIAEQLVTKAIEINPKDASTYVSRGNARGKLEDYQAAIDDFDKALSIDSSLDDAYFNRGIAKSKLENHQAAIDDFTRALLINPVNVPTLVVALLSKLNDDNAAIDDLQAIEIDPMNLVHTSFVAMLGNPKRFEGPVMTGKNGRSWRRRKSCEKRLKNQC